MNNSKKMFGLNIMHRCDYCQNCVTLNNTNFCKVKKKINAKGKCPKFTYNPTMRKVTVQTMEKYSKEDFTL